jgi:RDD family
MIAFFLDLLLCAGCADVLALVATALVWRFLSRGQSAITAIWAAAAAAALVAFLLRDARGGRARRWFGLKATRPDGRPPGAAASVRRNLPLLVPGWNLVEAWPVLRDGTAARPADRRTGIRILQRDGDG